MAAEDCIAEIKRVVGKDLNDDQIIDAYESFTRALQRRREDAPAEGIVEAHQNAAGTAVDGYLAGKIIEHRNAYKNAMIRVHLEDYVQTKFGADPVRGIEAILVGLNAAESGSRRSASAAQRSLSASYLQGLIAKLERSGTWDAFRNGELDQEIYRALWARDVDGAKRGSFGETSDTAEQIADVIYQVKETARLDANGAGAWIGKTPGHVVTQGHDMFKIRRAGGEAYKRDLMEFLDEKTFDGKDPDKFLESVYAANASGVHMTTTGVDGTPVFNPSSVKAGNLADGMSKERVLHFKSPDAAYEYNLKYGNGSLRETLMFSLDQSGKNTALMRTLGTNPGGNLDQVIRNVLKRTKDPDVRQKLNDAWKSERGLLRRQLAELDGSVNIPGNAMGAKWSGIMRAIQSMAKLGGAVLSAISDLPLVASELRYQGFGFFDRWGIALKSLGRGKGSIAQREIMGQLGVTLDGMVGSMIHRFSGQDDLPGAFSRLMRTFFKFNGLTWWTDSLRMGSALGMSERLARVSGQGWKDMDPDLQRVLNLFGIDDGKWDLIRRQELADAGDQRFLSPEMARMIPDEDAGAYLQSKGVEPTPARIRDLKTEIEDDFRSYFIDRTEYAVINPDERTNATLRRGLNPGTIEGEVMRFVMQFKSFPIAVLQKPLGREIYGRGAGVDAQGLKGFVQALTGKGGEMQGLTRLVIGTTIFGYLAMTAKDLAKGRTPRDPTDPKTWVAAMVQGGGAGIYGDFLFGETKSRFGQSALDTMLGPSFGTASSLVDLFGNAKEGSFKAARGLSFLVNNTPFANLFYTRLAADYLFLYGLRDSLAPGYARRVEKRAKRDNDQTYWLSPQSALGVN